MLLKRLPEPKVDKRRWDWANRLRLVGRSWHADMKPAVLNWGWRLLAKNDRNNLMNGAYIIRCLGGKDDLRRFMKILDRGLVAMKDDPVEQGSYPRPPTASAALVDAGWELVGRGAKVPTDTQTPGQAVLFMLALSERENFRPSNWEITAAELLKHPIPYVREIAVKNLPIPLHMSLHEPVLALIKDDYSPVQVQACNLAAKNKSERFRTPLLDILEEIEDRWVLCAAYNAAFECGVNRDYLLEICVERLADNDLAITLFDLIIKVVEHEGGYGYSQVDWSKVSELKNRWKLLIEDNRDRIRAGQLFKIAEPPLTPDLFPRGFRFHRKNKTSWPEWPKDIRTRKAPRVYIDAANKRLRHNGSGIYRASSEYKEGYKFWDHQKKPIPTVIAGERATQIRNHMAALFVPCSVRERKRAEKALVELISTYKLLENSVEADATWSSPVNFASVSNRHAVVVFLHAGTGHDVSVWVLCELKDAVKSFSFKGSAKGCGYWQVCNDLDADGDAEIIIKHYVGDYDGAGTIAVWPAIYKWNGNIYIRADEQFPDYYAQNVAPKYERIVEQHKDWRNHINKQVRTIYEKCKFVLQKARTIAQKRNQNLELVPVLQRIELPDLAVSLGMSVDEVAESFANIDFTHKPEQRWQRNGHSFWKHEEITCDVVHLRRLNNQLENARFIFENHQLVEIMLTIIDVQNCLKPLLDALDLLQVEPGIFEGLDGQILMRAGDGNAEKQTWIITRK